MVKTHIKSWFEVWHSDYINTPGKREDWDKNLIILQVEHSAHYEYIVELIKPDDYKQPLFSMKG